MDYSLTTLIYKMKKCLCSNREWSFVPIYKYTTSQAKLHVYETNDEQSFIFYLKGMMWTRQEIKVGENSYE